MSTGTSGIGAEGALSGTDPQPPCSLHSCLDSVQLHRKKKYIEHEIFEMSLKLMDVKMSRLLYFKVGFIKFCLVYIVCRRATSNNKSNTEKEGSNKVFYTLSRLQTNPDFMKYKWQHCMAVAELYSIH